MTAVSEAADRQVTSRGRIFGHLRDRLAASDPAFSRLRLASRAILSLVASGAVLAGLTLFVHTLPIAAFGLSFMLSFVGSMAIRDKAAKAQIVTRSLAVPVIVVSVFLASALSGIPWAADLVFLGVIFAAVYVRRYGLRWFAIGMMAFLAFFMGDYLKPPPGQIGWIAVAAAIALAITHLVGNFLLPADEERDFRRALVTIDRRINLILRQFRHAAQAGALSKEDHKAFRAHIARLRDIVLMAEGFLPQGSDGSLAAKGAASEVAVALFDLQLVVERLVRSRHIALPPVDLVQAVLDHDEKAVMAQAVLFRDDGPDDEIPARHLVRVQRARSRLADAIGPQPSPAFLLAGSDPAPPSPPQPGGAGGRIPQAFQPPIQVTLACAIAMGVGLLVSPVRWYWAVITAFIVFNNTRSRGDTAIRALQRSAGTFGGFLVGTAVATLLQGQMVVSGVMILVLFFLAFYFVQTSYSIMIFFITIALALIYGMMGMFTPEILILRLEETVIGALAGTAMAFFVFPKRTSSGVAEALEGYWRALGDLVAAAAARVADTPDPESLLALSRGLDRKYADLAVLVRPLGGPWNAVTRFGQVRERLLLLSGLAHWSRVLAQRLSHETEFDQETRARVENVAARIERQIESALEKREAFFENRRREDSDTDLPQRRPLILSERDHPVVALEAISALLERAGSRAPAAAGGQRRAPENAVQYN